MFQKCEPRGLPSLPHTVSLGLRGAERGWRGRRRRLPGRPGGGAGHGGALLTQPLALLLAARLLLAPLPLAQPHVQQKEAHGGQGQYAPLTRGAKLQFLLSHLSITPLARVLAAEISLVSS